MRFHRSFLLTATLLVASCGIFGRASQAQDAQKPIAIVSFSPLEQTLPGVSYLLRATNFPEIGGLVSIMTNQYAQGIDRKRPLGMAVNLEQQMPTGILFIPLADRQQFFAALATMGIEPDDLGDGLFEIDANGQTLFAKDANSWLYIAQTEQALANVPEDPAQLLGELPNKYAFAIRINVQALPQELRDMATEQMRMGFERTLAEQSEQTPEEQAAAREMGENQIAQIEQFMSETDQVIFGWAIDSQGQKTYMDGAAQFLEGSKFAAQADAMKNLKSDYAAFTLPKASVSFRATSEITEASDKEAMKQNLGNSISQLEQQLQEADVAEQSKELLTELLATVRGLLEKTIDEGKFDGASSISVDDNTLRFLIGGRIADGRVLEQELKKLVSGLPEGPSTPTAEFGYETFEGVTLHRLLVPVKIDDPAARKVFGEQLNFTIGTAEKGFMVSLDPAGDASLKAAISSMAAASGKVSNPLEGVVELAQLLSFAQAVSPNSALDLAAKTIQEHAASDNVQVLGSVIPRGIIYRLTIEEGVLRAVGAAAKAGNARGGGF